MKAWSKSQRVDLRPWASVLRAVLCRAVPCAELFPPGARVQYPERLHRRPVQRARGLKKDYVMAQ